MTKNEKAMSKQSKFDPDYKSERTKRILKELNSKIPGVEYFAIPKKGFNFLSDKMPKKTPTKTH